MSKLISDEYRAQNAEKHETSEVYGADNAHRWVKMVNALTWEYETFSVLDYGCGKGNLARMMTKMPIHNYDPAIPEFSATPAPDDIVICTDVMEHVEPDCLDAVIDDLKRVTNIVLVVNISLQPSLKHMPDGSNAHLIVEDIEFWMTKFLKYFDLSSVNGENGKEMTMVLFKRVEH
jgi:hypothetical protein